MNVSDFTVLNVNQNHQDEVIDYGVEMVGAPLEWGETMGQGIRVGIIDTGIDLTHEDLRDNIREYRNFTDNNPRNVQDENGHGTHVAGIIAAGKNGFGVVGVAPMAQLYIARAFGKDGHSAPGAIKRSLEWLISRNVHVINMSFSSDKDAAEYYSLLKRAYQMNITLVAAAGNKGQNGGDTISFPARYDEVIAVTAVDASHKRARFSSEGAKAEIAAAGKNIYSCYPTNSYAMLSGTSMATPIITGAAALLHAKAIIRFGRRLTPAEVRFVMGIYAEQMGELGHDSEYGFGLFSFGRLDIDERINPKYPASKRARRGSREFMNFIASALRG